MAKFGSGFDASDDGEVKQTYSFTVEVSTVASREKARIMLNMLINHGLERAGDMLEGKEGLLLEVETGYATLAVHADIRSPR